MNITFWLWFHTRIPQSKESTKCYTCTAVLTQIERGKCQFQSTQWRVLENLMILLSFSTLCCRISKEKNQSWLCGKSEKHFLEYSRINKLLQFSFYQKCSKHCWVLVLLWVTEIFSVFYDVVSLSSEIMWFPWCYVNLFSFFEYNHFSLLWSLILIVLHISFVHCPLDLMYDYWNI